MKCHADAFDIPFSINDALSGFKKYCDIRKHRHKLIISSSQYPNYIGPNFCLLSFAINDELTNVYNPVKKHYALCLQNPVWPKGNVSLMR